MITLWRRTLNRFDPRCELRHGDFLMAYFDNRKKATDWLWERLHDREDLINEMMSEVDHLRDEMEEWRDFLEADTHPFMDEEHDVFQSSESEQPDQRKEQ